MINLRLERRIFTDNVTIGDLYVNNVLTCYTLEDAVRLSKIKGITAIPKGKYKVILNMSNRFKMILPLLINVPNYEGVRIHAGNTHANTEGCILVGNAFGIDIDPNIDWHITPGTSRPAMANLLKILRTDNEIYIEIVNKTDDPGK